MKKSDIPNVLTVLRGVMTVVIGGLFFVDFNKKFYWILGLFLLASATDLLDGYIARKFKWESKFGVVMDSFLDKVLIIGMMILLVPYNLVPIWVWALLLIRELIIDSIKNLLNAEGKTVKPLMSGKIKMVVEVGLVTTCLLRLINEMSGLIYLSNFLGLSSLFFAYYSGYFYIKDFWKK